MDYTEKLRDCFDEMVVYKDLKKTNFFTALSLPSFMRDWLLKKFEDEEGSFDKDDLARFVKKYIPRKDDWNSIKNRIIIEGEHVKFLAKVSVNIDIKTGEVSFSLPDFGLGYKETIIESDVWEECKDDLVRGGDTWGMIELGYRSPEDFDFQFEYEQKRSKGKSSQAGKIKLISFKNFCPYQIDLDQYKDARRDFTTEEWMDVILGAVDYNAAGYRSEEQKLTMITRLLPFVEKRLNLIELAPKGTGKSYLAKEIATDIISNGYFDDYTLLTNEQKKQIEFVQFHPSYDYSDFVEGLRPRVNDDGTMGFELQDGVFKKFVARARKNYENSQKSKELIEKEMSVQESMTAFFSSIELGVDTFRTINGNEFSITGVDDTHISISIPGNANINKLRLNIDEIRDMLESGKKFDKIKDVTAFFGKTFATQAYSYDFAIY